MKQLQQTDLYQGASHYGKKGNGILLRTHPRWCSVYLTMSRRCNKNCLKNADWAEGDYSYSRKGKKGETLL